MHSFLRCWRSPSLQSSRLTQVGLLSAVDLSVGAKQVVWSHCSTISGSYIDQPNEQQQQTSVLTASSAKQWVQPCRDRASLHALCRRSRACRDRASLHALWLECRCLHTSTVEHSVCLQSCLLQRLLAKLAYCMPH
jgi:hypothetical protein